MNLNFNKTLIYFLTNLQIYNPQNKDASGRDHGMHAGRTEQRVTCVRDGHLGTVSGKWRGTKDSSYSKADCQVNNKVTSSPTVFNEFGVTVCI